MRATRACTPGDWLRFLRRKALEVEDLIEVCALAARRMRYLDVTLHWARRWPAEEIWKARRR